MSIEKRDANRMLLGYELTPRQDALVNHLVPSLGACILYVLLIAGDVGVIFRHYKDDDPIWGSLTLFILYVPVLASFIIVISNWELWPEFESCSRNNLIWFWTKVAEHLLFPIWSMWRFAERIFWSIEAVRAPDDKSIAEAVAAVTDPRSIELYVFLQSYLHSLPQVLLQLYVLVRHNADINSQTANVQIMSIVLNIVKISVTTTYYQRFKSQKLSGKRYPWYKHYKSLQPQSPSQQVVLRRHNVALNRPASAMDERLSEHLEPNNDEDLPRYSAIATRRRSSDLYMDPLELQLDEPVAGPSGLTNRQTLLETDFDEEVQTRIKVLGEKVFDNTDAPPASFNFNSSLVLSWFLDASGSVSRFHRRSLRSTSITDGPWQLYRAADLPGRSEPDFNISRVIYVKGMEDDDLAGRLIAIVWWFTFLLARVLAISVFAYFYIKETVYLMSLHFLLVLGILAYDVRSNDVDRSRALFFFFIGFVYIFCIIEFKIKFKRATAIFYGFFFVVFLENIVMCLVWYFEQMESLENDFWFRYVFYIIIACMFLSFSAMVFYFALNKPDKVTVATIVKK
ncbi:unnamed protein product [Phyllotreta striolata]|uniref:XK-related protein n=1 Tax=Phyllotreta striolata TaxID=444603 RepID=A0A9P0GW65_PHYSR|nr:unnamed protein product [Phyllotreta striolata]